MFIIEVFGLGRKAMDPDRYQMKDLKRRVGSLEAALERANVRIRNLQARQSQISEDSVLYKKLVLAIEDKITTGR